MKWKKSDEKTAVLWLLFSYLNRKEQALKNMRGDILRAVKDWCTGKFQPKGDYLTEIPEYDGYSVTMAIQEAIGAAQDARTAALEAEAQADAAAKNAANIVNEVQRKLDAGELTGPQGLEGPAGPMPTLTENLLATVPGTALDATMGKQLKDELDSQGLSFAKSIGELNTSLTTSTTTVVLNDSSINATFSFQKIGKIVLVQIQFVKATFPYGWRSIVNIPDGYQPRVNGVTSGIDIYGKHIIMTTENNVIRLYSITDIEINYLYTSMAYVIK